MRIAELFVAVGLTDENVVVKGLKKINEGFKEIVSSSTQTKLAVAGMLYGLERITSSASRTGSELFKFREAFGMSTKDLQEWEAAAREFGAEDMVQSTLQAIQSAKIKRELGHGDNEAFARMNIKTEGQNASQILEQFRVKLKNMSGGQRAVGLELVSGLIGPEMAQALINMDKHKLRMDQYLSDGQINKLQKINAQWAQFWHNLKMVANRLIADYGKDVITWLDKIPPVLEAAARELRKFLGELASGKFGEAIKNLIPNIKEAFGDFQDFLKNTNSSFKTLRENADAIKAVFAGLGVLILAALGPVAAQVALIAGSIGLVISAYQELKKAQAENEKESPEKKAGLGQYVQDTVVDSFRGQLWWAKNLIGMDAGKWETSQDLRAGAAANARMNVPSKPLSGLGGEVNNNSNSQSTHIIIDNLVLTDAESKGIKQDIMNVVGTYQRAK